MVWICKILASIAICIVFISTRANERDSLRNVTRTGSIVNKVDAFNKLARMYLGISPDTANVFCDSALALCNDQIDLGLRAVALKNKGIIFYYKGEYADALDYYSKSLEVYSVVGDSAGVAAINNNKAIIYEMIGDFESAVRTHLLALKFYERFGTKKEIARSYTNLATLYGTMKHFQVSRDYHASALKIYEHLKDSFGIANIYNNMASNYNDKGDYDSALFYHLKALEIRTNLNDVRGIATSLINVGNGYRNLKEPKKAINFYDQAMVHIKKLDDKRGETGLLIAKANAYYNLSEFGLAEDFAKDALTIAEKYDFQLFKRDIFYLLSTIYSGTNRINQAYLSLSEYLAIKDSIENIERANYLLELDTKYQVEKKNQQIHFQEVEINLQKKELKQNRLILLLSAIMLFLAAGSLSVLGWALHLKRKSNAKVTLKNQQLTEQKKQITDSIHYAERIQHALMPNEENLQSLFSQSFVIWYPRDIVSGDFWWLWERDETIVVAVADCTGHGVPGALLSMLGLSFIGDIVNLQQTVFANEILNQLRLKVKKALKQTGKNTEARDGINMSVLVIDKKLKRAQFSGAFSNMYLLNQSGLIEYKGDRNPIGVYIKEHDSFTNHIIELIDDDTFYLFSDGYIDQFHHETKTRYGSQRFKELITRIGNLPMHEQKLALDSTFKDWKGDSEQIDDLIVMGIKIG